MKIKTIILSLTCVLCLSSTPALAKQSAKKQKVLHVCKKNDTTVNVLACNLYREARGESDHGMLAVGFVTLNRRDHKRFPASVKKIVYQKGQFSWTNYKNGTFKVHDKEDWEKSKAYASALLTLHEKFKYLYKLMDFTKGSTYYHSRKIKPYWTKSLIKTVSIDNHVFYKENSKPQGT